MERQEVAPNQPLEATYVTIVKRIVHKEIPAHGASFDIALNEINRQITGDGLFQWESKSENHKGVKFLAGHLSITADLIQRIANQTSQAPKTPSEDQESEDTQRLEHYAYFVQPSFGLPPDGSALSVLDMGIDRFIKEMPKVARALRNGERPPTVDIYLLGGPTALGAEITRDFVDAVEANGFSEYGKLYAEFAQEFLPHDQDALDKTRIVLQGVSKGTVTAEQTFLNLPDAIKSRTQLLFDNTAASQGRNLPTRIGRSANMAIGMGAEMVVRIGADILGGSTIPKGAFKDQGKFYKDILKAKGIPEDSDEQKKLKGELFTKGEIATIAKGTPFNEKTRAYSRISTSDPVNINFDNATRVDEVRSTEMILGGAYTLAREVVNRLGGKMKPWARRGLVAKQKGRILTFATENGGHNFPWVRSVDSGSWAQKMEYVENTKPRKAA